MLRAFSGGNHRNSLGLCAESLDALRSQFRLLNEAIRFGDLSEAEVAFGRIQQLNDEHQVLHSDVQLAFDALGTAIASGSLSDSADGLRLLRLGLQASRENGSRSDSDLESPHDDSPPETRRSAGTSGFASATLRAAGTSGLVSSIGEELPETATIFEIDVAG
jgi:hypothetical protein